MSHLKPGTTYKFQDQQWLPVTVGKRKRKENRTVSKSLKDIIESLSQKKEKPQRTSTEVPQHYNGLPSSSPIADERNKKTTSLSETNEEISSSESWLETQETSACDSRLSEQGTPLHSNSLGSLSRELQKDKSLVQAKSRVRQEKSWHLNSKTSPKQNRKMKNKQPPSRILKMSDFVSESTSYESSKQLSHPYAQRNLLGSKKRISAEEQKSESIMEKLKKFRMPNKISEKPLMFKNMSSLSKNPQESEEDELKQLEKLKNKYKNSKSVSVNEEHRNQYTPEINVERRYNSVKALEKRLKSVEAEKSHFQRLVSHLERQRAEVEYAKVKAWTELERLKKEKESQANEIKRQKVSIDNLRKEIQLTKHCSEEVERRLQQEKRRNNKMATNIEEPTKINTRLQSQLKQGVCLENEKNTGNSMANSESPNYKLQCKCLQAELQENKKLVTELQNEKQKLLSHNSDLLEKVVMYLCDVNILKEKCASEKDILRISQLEAEKKELSSCNRELSEKVRGFEKMLEDVKKAHTLLVEENAKNEVKKVEVCQNQSQPDLKQQEIDKLKKEVTYLKYTRDVIAKEREHLKSPIQSLQSENSSLSKDKFT